MQTVDACKYLCYAEPQCQGIQYMDDGGYCKVWIRPAGIGATSASPGSLCILDVTKGCQRETFQFFFHL